MNVDNASKVLFLDRDGTLIVEKNYLSNPDDVELCDKAIEGLKGFLNHGYRIVVVTNQSGIGRGYFSVEEMKRVHKKIDFLLSKYGIRIDQYLHCPHVPDVNCSCRKPKIGMLDSVISKEQIDWKHSLMIGDKSCDIEFGKNAGMTSILVKTGYGALYDMEAKVLPDVTVVDLLEAFQWVENRV